jgi:hypothetical protein
MSISNSVHIFFGGNFDAFGGIIGIIGEFWGIFCQKCSGNFFYTKIWTFFLVMAGKLRGTKNPPDGNDPRISKLKLSLPQRQILLNS